MAENPGLTQDVIGAVSIARRLRNPLSEYVKMDPKTIGVGMYQHDVQDAKLKKNLEEASDPIYIRWRNLIIDFNCR